MSGHRFLRRAWFPAQRAWLVLALLAIVQATAAAATVELLSGANFECTVLSKDDKNVTVEVMMSGMKVKRVIPLSSVYRVTINDKQYVINPRSPVPEKKRSTAKGTPPATSAGATDDKGALRTRTAIEARIKEQGRTPPDWFEATPLNYPPSLDLSWPEKPEGGWNNQKNVGQYVWDIVNPNPSKWREGVKLMHHLLTLHQDDRAQRTRIMVELGRMYYNLHEDHARAAFWWQQAGVDKTHSPPGCSIHLAECYWRLGNKQMAVDHLRKMRSVPYDAIKLWADMGEPQQALALVESIAKNPRGQHHLAYLLGGDACRVAGRYDEAIEYYQKVLAVPSQDPGKGQIDRCHQRARASLEAIRLFELTDVASIADGDYRAESLGYEGPVEVEVAVRSGRIESVRVTQHREKQFYSAMNDTPAKILAKQGVKGVDATSSATITSEAIINATAKALASAAEK